MKSTTLAMGFACGALVFLGAAQAEEATPAAPPAAAHPTIEFKTVAEALEAVKADANMHVTTTEGPDVWTVAGDKDGLTQWSFTPPGYYAYPAVVKRTITRSENGDVYVQMASLCEAEKSACDALTQDFRAANEYMRQALQRSTRQSRAKQNVEPTR